MGRRDVAAAMMMFFPSLAHLYVEKPTLLPSIRRPSLGRSEMQRTVLLGLLAVLIGTSASNAEPNMAVGRTIVAQTFCPEVEIPVCASKDGQRKTYGNDCKARRDGATNITPGPCTATK